MTESDYYLQVRPQHDHHTPLYLLQLHEPHTTDPLYQGPQLSYWHGVAGGIVLAAAVLIGYYLGKADQRAEDGVAKSCKNIRR